MCGRYRAARSTKKSKNKALNRIVGQGAIDSSQHECAGDLEIQIKIFNCWGTIERIQKSGERESADETSLTQLQRHCGRSNYEAIDSYQPLRYNFSILRAYSPEKWYLYVICRLLLQK
ncbi:hypothetical protein [Microcoleus sp. herbarium12]|uniref:hypothetical protein n=1 Tax=Microcoleus sp. herbarium12 TaxID=3055437 RepID=UPI002FD21E76